MKILWWSWRKQLGCFTRKTKVFLNCPLLKNCGPAYQKRFSVGNSNVLSDDWMDYLWVSQTLGRSTSLLCYFIFYFPFFFIRDKRAKSRPLSHYPSRRSNSRLWLSWRQETQESEAPPPYSISFSSSTRIRIVSAVQPNSPEARPASDPDQRPQLSLWVKNIYIGPHRVGGRALANLTSRADVTRVNSWRVASLGREMKSGWRDKNN